MKPFWNDGVSKPLAGGRKGLNKLSMLRGCIYCKISENVTNVSRIQSYQPCLWSIVKKYNNDPETSSTEADQAG